MISEINSYTWTSSSQKIEHFILEVNLKFW